MAIEVFNRYEHKYLLDDEKYEKVLGIMDEHMSPDPYCADHKFYTIANIYYDTPEDLLVKRSLDKPEYKEKLRLRAYGVPNLDSDVFLEIKKKYNGKVNKRRTTLKLNEAYNFIESGEIPSYKEYMNAQVLKELEYFLNVYDLSPKAYIAYDRLAYFENGNADLRISFDKNIRTRRSDVRLEDGDFGKKLIPDNMHLMEVKTALAKPLWLAEMISEYGLEKTSFSKYGTEFMQYLAISRIAESKAEANRKKACSIAV